MKAFKFNEILEILKELDFHVSKDIEKPTFFIKTASPILKKNPDNKTYKSFEFSIKATHSSRAVNYLAILEILDLFEEDKSFLLKTNPYNFGGYSGNVTSNLYVEVLKN